MAVTIVRTANPSGVDSSGGVSTYSGVSIGAAAPNRIVVVLVGTEVAAGSINSVTLGGVAMTAGTQGNQTSVYARAFYLLYPTGTTANVAVTFGAATLSTNNHIAVYTVTDAVYSSTGADQTTDMDATDPLTTGSTTIGTGGGMIAVVAGGSGTPGNKTWTNLTEDLDADGGSFSFCTAYSTSAGTATRTCQGTVTNEDGALSYLIFTDNTEPTVALNSPADTASTGDLTPTLNFTGTDAQSDEVEYQVQIHTDNLFGTITDDFNRADSSTLGGNWSLGPESIAHSNVGPQILSNRAYNEGTSDCDAFYSGASFNDAQFSQATLKSINSGTDDFSGVLVRASATDYIMVQANKFGGNYRMYWYNAGAYTSLGSYSATPAVNDVMRLEASGTTFYFYLNGVLRITGSDAGAPTSGAPGIILSGSNADQSSLDDWSGGDTAVLIDAYSATDAGFTAGHPFPSGDATDYTVQSALTDTVTYYWRARAIDPAGSNTWGAWATTRSFTTSSGSESYDKTATLATLTLTPQDATMTYASVWNKTGSLAQVTLTPLESTMSYLSVLNRTSSLAELTLTPQDSVMSYIEAYSKTVSLATLTLTPQAPTESYSSAWSKTASLAQLTLTPQTPTSSYVYEVSKTADLTTLTLTPQDTTMGYASVWSKTSALAQLLLTPQDATVDYLESAEYNRTASLAQLTLTPKNITSDSLVWWSTINQYNLILVDGDPAIKLANGLYNKV